MNKRKAMRENLNRLIENDNKYKHTFEKIIDQKLEEDLSGVTSN